jgi:hypothetical protein
MKIKQSILGVLVLFLLVTACTNNQTQTPTVAIAMKPTNTEIILATNTAIPTFQPTETMTQATVTLTETTAKPAMVIQYPTKTPTCFPTPFDAELQNPASLQDSVGYIFRDLPEYLELQMGAVILGRGDYGLSEVVREDGSHMLWFEKVACRDADSKAYWEILDVIELPPLADNEELVIWYCRLAGEDDTDPELVVIGNCEPGVQYLTQVNMAWRLNRQTNQIETIPTEGIECLRDTGEGKP